MAYGFVYLLGNEAMPCYYKIGCTDRAPHQRARELSMASGVPQPFQVLLYIEVEDAQQVERRFHRELAAFRATHQREFFCFGPAHMTWLWYVFETYMDRMAFASPNWHRYSFRPRFPDDYVDTWTDDETYLYPPEAAPLQPGAITVVAA